VDQYNGIAGALAGEGDSDAINFHRFRATTDVIGVRQSQQNSDKQDEVLTQVHTDLFQRSSDRMATVAEHGVGL
jgi:hypothetical protein